jgi:hypothetical protein
MSGQYEDIIHMAYPVPSRRQRMSMIDRAAQFSPFAALVGYDDAIEETARLIDQRIELDENEKYMLDIRQHHLLTLLPQRPQVTVTYFSPDDRKEGGEYVTITGRLKSILPHADTMILSDGTRICLKDVIALDSPVFQNDY